MENPESDACHYARSVSLLLSENKRTLEQVDYQAIKQFVYQVSIARRIFLTGEGRSGLVARMFAMRLMHLGYQVYVVGETITPLIRDSDLLIACSGSGSTGNTCNIALVSKKVGAQVISVTTQIKSPLAEMADLLVEVKAASKHDQSNEQSKQFAGSLFEQSVFLLFDTIFYLLSQQMDKSNETLWSFHTNLE